jgi:hypothetical protein
MAKRRKRKPREKAATVAYRDADGNVLELRESLSAGTIAKIRERSGGAAGTVDDVWRRRQELLFERLAVSWEISGLPLTEQAMLLGRYRMADPATQEWVRETLRAHVESHIPELMEG